MEAGRMRRFLPNRASVLLAGLAVFVVVVGASAAASRYIITSKKQISPAVLKELKGVRGVRGPKGVPGPSGAVGPAGQFSTSDVQVVQGAGITVEDYGTGTASAMCPAGSVAVGGGFNELAGGTGSVNVVEDAPSSDATGWTVRLQGTSAGVTGAFAYAVCAS
jgi:hypothetical protein